VKTDSSGNVYSVGYIADTETYGFGNGVTATGSVSDGGYSSLLVKYDASGTAQWARSGSGSGSAFNAVTLDSSGNAYAAGSFAGAGATAAFGNGITATTTTPSSVLLVKYNTSGTAQWARITTSGSASSSFNGVTTDSSGHVYAAGTIRSAGTYGFGNNVTVAGTCNTSMNVVLVKYQ
jgi:hypothetical protein